MFDVVLLSLSYIFNEFLTFYKHKEFVCTLPKKLRDVQNYGKDWQYVNYSNSVFANKSMLNYSMITYFRELL